MLCQTCKSIFGGPVPAAKSSSGSIVWHDHHTTEKAIQSSANAGCQICVPLWRDTDFHNSKYDGPDSQYPGLFTLYAVEPAEKSLEETIKQGSDFVLLLRISAKNWTWDLDMKFYILSGKNFGQTVTQVSTHNQVAHDPLDLSSNDCTQLYLSVRKEIVSQWLSNCVQNHPECCTLPSESWFPTRLIDLGPPSSNFTPRLIITHEHPAFQVFANSPRIKGLSRPVYATLSHCWGKLQPLKLLTSNIDDMKQSFSMDLVPKTFADAFLVAKDLGIQFIWIDSLCIIQDSRGDWLKESAMMGTVYGAAHLNIAATGVVDGSEGLLFNHDPRYAAPTQISIGWEGLPEKLYLVIEDKKAWGNRFEDFPLCQRAWILQERILAPRILHFTKEQYIWECRRHVLSEFFPNGLPNHLRDYHAVRNFVLPSLQGSFPVAWARVIRLYTRAKLTFPQDKLTAISGLASEMRRCGHVSGRYIAGMWESQLPISLL
jgi:Heterokaryon incompatibility protein (HET)